MKDIRFKPEASNPKPIIHFPEWGADQEKPQVTGAFDDEDEQGMRDMHGQDS